MRHRTRHPDRHPGTLAGLTATFAVTAAIVLAWSLVRYETRPLTSGPVAPWVTGGLVSVVWAAAVLVHRWPTLRRAVRRSAVVVPVATVALLAAGTVTQTSIGDRPLPATSARAHAVRDARLLIDSLDVVVAADTLLDLPDDQARVRTSDLEAARVAVGEVVAAVGGDRSWANPDFVDAARATAQASDLAAQALGAKLELAAAYDARVAQELTVLREALVSEALRAGTLISSGAQSAGVTDVLRGPVTE